jgi:hypothetical protein
VQVPKPIPLVGPVPLFMRVFVCLRYPMYGKIFEMIYDGTLSENWQALITFQQMIVLCDSDGNIDMTPSAISRRTGIPLEHIETGIEFLERVDPYSRTPDEDGRRIIRLDEHRNWGWKIVNHKFYRGLASREDKKAADRERIAIKRGMSRDVADCSDVSRMSPMQDARCSMQDTIKTPLTPQTKKRKKKQEKPFIPPTLQEVESYFDENGYTKDSAKRAWEYYEAGSPPWTDSRGNKVISWKQKMRAVWFKSENMMQIGIVEPPEPKTYAQCQDYERRQQIAFLKNRREKRNAEKNGCAGNTYRIEYNPDSQNSER